MSTQPTEPAQTTPQPAAPATEQPKSVFGAGKWTTGAWSFKPAAKADASKTEKKEEAKDDEPVDDSHDMAPAAAEVQPNVDENEDEMFAEKALLYRLDQESKEWKERGVGIMKILKNKTDGKCRVLMRRNQTFRVCANHFILPHMELKANQGCDRAFIWSANDFADGKESHDVLSIKFKTPEIAQKYKKSFEDARALNKAILDSQPKKE